jgi:hypothetical protein
MIIPVDGANFVILHTIAGDAEPMQTAVGVDASAAGGDYDALLSDLVDAWLTAWSGEYSDQTTIGPYRLEVGQDGGDPIIVENAATVPGDNSDEPLPPNCALLVRKATASGGRRNRGRMYIPGLALRPSTSPAGVLDGGAFSALDSDAAAFRIAVEASPLVGPDGLLLFHSESPATATPITQLLVQQKIATQRRRLRP